MKNLILLILSATLILSSCQKSTKNTSTDLSSSRQALLENITNNIIIPSYENLQIEIENLHSNAQIFTNNATPVNLTNLRNAWHQAYLSWQHVEMFTIGKAEAIDYTNSMNTFPCNTTQINNNISSQSYNLNNANFPSWSSQGFPALDYMLYGLDSDSNLILNYYTNIDSAKYLTYLTDIILQMKSNTDLIIEDWQANKENFTTSNGNTASSSLNILTNDFIYYYEKGLRANKIGIPCGIWNGFQIYEIGVEAYYRKDISKQLAIEALNACKNFFIGKGTNSIVGFSYNDLLVEIGNTELSDNILATLSEAELAINELDNNFRTQLTENNTNMLNAYDALQNLVPLLKVNMLYSLNITVDYTDSDGD